MQRREQVEQGSGWPRAWIAGTVLLLAVVVFLRGSLYGIRADLPETRVSTELEQVQRAVRFGGTHDLNPHYFLHPPLFAYVLCLLYAVLFLFGRMTGWIASASAYERMFFSNPTMFLLAGRFLTLLLGIGSLLIAYRLARRLFGEVVACWTVLLMAMAPVMITWAHYASGDIATLCVSLWALLMMARLLDTDRWSQYLIAGCSVGVAAGMKYHAILLGAALLMAHALRCRREGQHWAEYLRSPKWLVACAAITGGFLLTCPYALLDARTFLASFAETARRAHAEDYQFASWKINRPGWMYLVSVVLPFSLGGPLAWLCVAGVLYSVWRRSEADWFVLAAVVPFMVVMSQWTMMKPRYFLPIIPLLLMAGGRLLRDALRFIDQRWCRFALAAMAAAGLMLAPLRQSWRFNQQIARRPITTQAKDWIEAHVPPGTAIAIFPGVPLLPNRMAIERQLARVRAHGNDGMRLARTLRYVQDFPKTYDLYELPFPWRDDFEPGSFDFPRLARSGVRYVITTTHVKEYLADPQRYRVQAAFCADVQHACTLAQSFHEDRPLIDVGFPYEEEVRIYACGSLPQAGTVPGSRAVGGVL